MLKHYLIFLLIIFCCGFEVGAQGSAEEEFRRMIDSAKRYTTHKAEERDLAELYFEKAFEKLSELNDSILKAEYYFEKSYLSMINNNSSLSEKECELGLRAIIDQPKTITYFKLNRRMGNNYYLRGDYSKSMVKFLDILFSIRNEDYVTDSNSNELEEIEAFVLSSVGGINYVLFAEKKSIDYLKRAVKKFEVLKNEQMLKHCYFGLANSYIEQGDLMNAEQYINKGFAIPQKNSNSLEMSDYYLTYSHYLLEVNELDSAYYYIDLAQGMMSQFGDLSGINLANVYKGQYFYQSKQYPRALKILEQTLANNETGEVDRVLIKSHLLLAKTHAKLNNYSKAYEYMISSLKLQNQILKNAETFFSLEFENQLEMNRHEYLDSIKTIASAFQLNRAQSELKEKSITNNFLLIVIGLFVILTPILIIILRINHKTNKKLNKTINENVVLFKEVHHRVKNNFQVISSLMNLQKHSAMHPETDGILTETQQRITSMALVHELLYKHDQVDEINIGIYINELVRSIQKAYDTDSTNVKFKINTNQILLKLDQAIPLGLILNEAVTNSVKHAFNNQSEGIIEITLSEIAEGQFFLTIGDNGVGISEKHLNNSNTLGLELIEVLTEQINGEKTIFNNNGTKIEIKFAA